MWFPEVPTDTCRELYKILSPDAMILVNAYGDLLANVTPHASRLRPNPNPCISKILKPQARHLNIHHIDGYCSVI